MGYRKKELVKLALEALANDDDILFVRDLVSVLPCSRSTFYNYRMDKLDTISDGLEKNRIALCKELRKKWRMSENAMLQTNLYKLIADEEEADRLNGSKQKHELSGKVEADVSHKFADEMLKNYGKDEQTSRD